MEAAWRGEQAHICNARYLHGTPRRKSDRHKREGHAHYPGRSVNLPCATDIARCWEGLAEGSRGRSSCLRPKRRRAEPVMSG